jgi:hypothetical protein
MHVDPVVLNQQQSRFCPRGNRNRNLLNCRDYCLLTKGVGLGRRATEVVFLRRILVRHVALGSLRKETILRGSQDGSR